MATTTVLCEHVTHLSAARRRFCNREVRVGLKTPRDQWYCPDHIVPSNCRLCECRAYNPLGKVGDCDDCRHSRGYHFASPDELDRDERIRQAAPALYAALQDVAEAMKDGGEWPEFSSIHIGPVTTARIRAAIAQVEEE